ncbi:MAG: DNA-directed RNA polymerase [Minicystis sp.]
MMTTLAKTALAAALALGALTGCRPALVPLTQEIREQNRLTDSELKNLQYYVSHTITLRKELESGGRQVTGNHKLVVVAGKTIEEVVVEAKTPGICIAVEPSKLMISFEQGTAFEFRPATARSLAASGSYASPPDADPFPGNHPPRAEPVRQEGLFSGGYMIWVEHGGTVPFMGKSFDPVDETASATLLIDAESLEQVRKQRKVLPGLRLPSKS